MISDVGYNISDVGYSISDVGYSISDVGYSNVILTHLAPHKLQDDGHLIHKTLVLFYYKLYKYIIMCDSIIISSK